MSGAVQPGPGKATRDAFGETLLRLGADPRIVVVGADLNKSTKADAFGKKYPERFFEVGVAEPNMIGVAAGLALAGKVPFCSSFACFVAGRFETIKMSVCYSGANVKIVGSHCGIGVGEDGYSQMGLEYIALMRSLPGMAIVQLADDVETEQAVEWMGNFNGPVFLRTTRQKVERVHGEGYRFAFGKGDVLRDGGRDVAILATGGTVAHALHAADALALLGVRATVVNIHTIKPLDADLVADVTARCGKLVTVEDHQVTGGLGGAVAEALADRHPARLRRLGIQDRFGESGTPDQLYKLHGIDAEGIARDTLAFVKAS